MRTLWLAALLFLATPVWAKPPKLVLFISVDSMSADLLLRSRANLKSGLAQAINQGAFFPSVRYDYAETVTAAGHATLATGANPWRHGIVSNRIIDRGTGNQLPMFSDPDHPALEAPTAVRDVSPVNLRAETLSDRLRLSTRQRGKSIAISGKPRASIAMAGRLGRAWWFEDSVGKFVTGTYYVKEFPDWVKAFNARKPADAYFGQSWALALPERAYAGDDKRPWETDYNALGRTFPHPLTGGMNAPGPRYYEALASTPMMNEVIAQMALAAIDGEQLGRDEQTDLLSIGFSAVDLVYHHFGPYSWEMQDTMVRLDRSIGEVIAAAEKAAGRGNVLVVITADHGGAAIPEEWTSSGLPASRVNPATLQNGLNQMLKKQFGLPLVAGIDEVDVYLDEQQIAGRKLDGPTVRRAVAQWLSQRPEVALAVAKDDLFETNEHAGYLRTLQTGYYPGRSGDVLMILREYQVLTGATTGTSHGSPYGYDDVVPLMLLGRNVRPGSYRQQIDAVDVAPTVAALMEIAAPSMAEGTPRAEAMLGTSSR